MVPTTAAADEILADKKVFVIPDILANAGGVTASYFEWVQDRQGYFWKESAVNEQLEFILREAFEDVVHFSDTHGVNNRIAAYMLAIQPGRAYHQAARYIRLAMRIEGVAGSRAAPSKTRA